MVTVTLKVNGETIDESREGSFAMRSLAQMGHADPDGLSGRRRNGGIPLTALKVLGGHAAFFTHERPPLRIPPCGSWRDAAWEPPLP